MNHRSLNILWLILSALAAQLGMVIAPAVLGGRLDATVLGISAFALAAFGWGLVRRSVVALLLGVPLGWALPAFWLERTTLGGLGGAVGLVAVVAYIVAATVWLRPQKTRTDLDWSVTESAPMPGPSMHILGAALLVAGPACGVAVWPAIERAAAVGHPIATGRALVVIGLIGTLVGLALVTDLVRGRPPLPGSRQRAIILAVTGGLMLASWSVWIG